MVSYIQNLFPNSESFDFKEPLLSLTALHELDPAFRKITLENQRLKDLVTDLKFHKDPVGEFFFFVFSSLAQHTCGLKC
jgi:hypothetical protein